MKYCSGGRYCRSPEVWPISQPLLTADIGALGRQLATNKRRITSDIVMRFGNVLRSALRTGDTGLRQAYVRPLMSQVVVEDTQIRIQGSRKALEHAVIANAQKPGAAVSSFAREWCARRETV